MKKAIVIILSLIMLLMSAECCFASQIIMLNPFTGEIVNRDESVENYVVTGTVTISGNCAYDTQKQKYVYTTQSTAASKIRSSVYGGMITTRPVELDPDAGSMIVIYRNGDEVDSSEYDNLKEPGVYVVRDQSVDRDLFRFTIVKEITTALKAYEIPAPFYITKVIKDGVELNYQGNTVALVDEGSYEIYYKCDAIQKVYNLDVKIDHTAPTLMISGVNENGVAKSTVTIGETEPESTLEIKRDGEYMVRSSELKDAGQYTIVYTDEAGNSVTYQFRINFFLDGSGWGYVAFVVAIAAAALIYYFYSRKNMRTY